MKVWPANEKMRQVLKHPVAGSFRETLQAGVEWPRDQFTMRRLKEGAILDKAPAAPRKKMTYEPMSETIKEK